jgi:uncharacterized phiE125 gp8 family phage protein
VIVTGCWWRTIGRRTMVTSAAVRVPTSPAPAEPIALEDAQRHLKQPASTPEDDLVTRWIRTARSLVERRTGYALVPQVWDFYLDRLGSCPASFDLPWWPVTAVDEFVVILEDETEVDVDPSLYWTMLTTRPAFVGITRVPSVPNLRRHQSVRVRVTAGYADAADIPPELIQAMYLLVGYFSRYRGDDPNTRDPLKESGAQAFCDRFILPGVA